MHIRELKGPSTPSTIEPTTNASEGVDVEVRQSPARDKALLGAAKAELRNCRQELEDMRSSNAVLAMSLKNMSTEFHSARERLEQTKREAEHANASYTKNIEALRETHQREPANLEAEKQRAVNDAVRQLRERYEMQLHVTKSESERQRAVVDKVQAVLSNHANPSSGGKFNLGKI